MSLGITKLYDPDLKGLPMRVACFMSGSGTNVRKIIEHQMEINGKYGEECPYAVVVIFTDSKKSKAEEIANKFKIPFKCSDIMDFYLSKGHADKRDLSLRPEFDAKTVEILDGYRVDAIALGGYMSILSGPILERYSGRIINVHPADLSKTSEDGTRRKYVGDHAVLDAILAGEKELRSSTHIARERVDHGEILIISKPLKVELPPDKPLEYLRKPENIEKAIEIADKHQGKLKEIGDWVIFPLTLEKIAMGQIEIDDQDIVYIDGEWTPDGYELD